MPETITLFAESIEDISPLTKDSIEITLAEVDVAQIVSEVGHESLLAEMKIEDIKEYLENKENEEKEDE